MYWGNIGDYIGKYYGAITAPIKGDTRSSDYGSFCFCFALRPVLTSCQPVSRQGSEDPKVALGSLAGVAVWELSTLYEILSEMETTIIGYILGL